MGTTRTLADGEAFVQGRSKDTAAALVTAAAELGLKGSVKTTYDGYRAPVEVVDAAGFGSTTESSTPENPADHSDEANAKYEGAAAEAQVASTGTAADADADAKQAATEAEADANAEAARADLFDPTKSTIAEVEAYLAGADDDERARVIAAESESTKPRKGVLDLAATQEGN
jgi:hypothetical protein